MAVLGGEHFPVSIEPLEGEEILWQGGPSKHAPIVKILHALSIGVFLAFIYAAVVGPLGVFLALSAPPNPRATVVTTPPPVHGWTFPFVAAGLLLGPALTLLCGAIYLGLRRSWYVVTSERVCIQSGGGSVLSILDLDKIGAVRVSSSWIERRFRVQTIDLQQASGPASHNMSTVAHSLIAVPTESPVLSLLVNRWLPRDNA